MISDHIKKAVQELVDARNELLSQINTVDEQLKVLVPLAGGQMPQKVQDSPIEKKTRQKRSGSGFYVSPARDAVLKVTKLGGVNSCREVAKKLGFTVNNVSNIYSNLMSKFPDHITRIGKGKYAFSTQFRLDVRTPRLGGGQIPNMTQLVEESTSVFKEDEEITSGVLFSLVKEKVKDIPVAETQIKSRIGAHLANLATKGKLVRIRPGVFTLAPKLGGK